MPTPHTLGTYVQILCTLSNVVALNLTLLIYHNRTEWSAIRFVTIQVINKIRWPCCGRPNWTTWSSVKLPTNDNYYKTCDMFGFCKSKHNKIQEVLPAVKKKCHLGGCVMVRMVQFLRHDTYCPVRLKSGQLIAKQIWEFCYSYD